MKIEEKKFPINIKGIAKVLEIYGFGSVEYSVRSESGRMSELWDQAYYVPGLPKYLRIIFPKGIHTSEGFLSTFIARCHDENDGYAELNLEEDKPGWQKAEAVEMFYIKYDPNTNLPNHGTTLRNQREKEVKALASAVYVTNEANQNLTPSQKEIIRWHFILGHFGFQHIQWLIRTWRLKVQGNSKVMANCESTKCSACEFGKGHRQPNKVNTINNNTMK